jgi:hypothetical protein
MSTPTIRQLVAGDGLPVAESIAGGLLKYSGPRLASWSVIALQHNQ